MTTSPEDTLTLVREVPATVRPLLSIVVCAFRHATLVGECLASIDAAAAPDLDLIVIDDGSPDDTLRVCTDHVFDPRLPVRVFTKKNAGLVDTLRRGTLLARAEHVVFIASDDAFIPQGIVTVLAGLRAGTWCGDATLCQAIVFGDVDEGPVYKSDMLDLFAQSPEERHRRLCLQAPRPMLLQATVFRTAFLRELDPWGRKLELDDWPTFILAFEAAAQRHASVEYLPELFLSRYRMHGGGVHKQLTRQLRITEQVAREVVPPRWRRLCLANVRIDVGLTYLYQRHIGTGLALCLRGLLTCPTPGVIARVARRGASFVWKRVARRLAPAGAA